MKLASVAVTDRVANRVELSIIIVNYRRAVRWAVPRSTAGYCISRS